MLEYINKLSHVSKVLSLMANKNLEQLEGKCNEPHETQDYYLGMLKRQAMLTHDLHLILKNRPAENLTTPYILLRALMDDFLHALYLEFSKTPDDDIIRINAQGYRDNYNSLKNLTNSSNQVYYGESFNYLSESDLEDLKKTFREREKNKKYFEDISTFKFKKFKTLTEIAEEINSFKKYNIARDRTFFLWKSFSSFVHYSNWCLEYELREDIRNFQQMEEALQYVLNTIHFCATYFERTKQTKTFLNRFLLSEMKFGVLTKMQNN